MGSIWALKLAEDWPFKIQSGAAIRLKKHGAEPNQLWSCGGFPTQKAMLFIHPRCWHFGMFIEVSYRCPKLVFGGCSLGKTMVISSISSYLSPITTVLYQLITSTAPPSGCVGSPSLELHYYSHVMLIIAAPSHTRIHGTENCGQVLLTHVFLCIWVWVKWLALQNGLFHSKHD